MPKTSYETLFRKAIAAGGERDYGTALDLLSRIVAESDSIPDAWLFLGRTLHALGDPAASIPAFRSYAQRKPGSFPGWFFLGRSYLACARADAAVRCLRKAVSLKDSDPGAWALLGFCELRLKRPLKAVSCLERAVNLAPHDTRIFRGYLNALYVDAARRSRHGDADMARQMLDFVIANGLDGLSQRLHRARALRELGRPELALEDLLVAQGHKPDDPSIGFQVAALRFAVGDQAAALRDIDALRSVIPDVPDAPWTEELLVRFRAFSSLNAGDAHGALAASLEALRKDGGDVGMRAIAAQANFELGRFEKAAAHFSRAAESDPRSGEVRLGLALSYWELGRYQEAIQATARARTRGADPDECAYVETLSRVRTGENGAGNLPVIQDLLRKRPGDLKLMYALGECLYHSGRPDLALGWFDQVLSVSPDHELSLLYRISALESTADSEGAFMAYSRYLEAYPDNGALRREYIAKLMEGERYDEAAKAIQGGLAYEPYGPAVGRILAVCLRNAGRFREAAAHYRNALAAQPRNEELLLGLALCLERSGARSTALELLKRGAAFLGNAVDPYLALGVLYYRAKRVEDAVDAFRKASDLAPGDSRPLRNLERLYARSGMQEFAARFAEEADRLEGRAGKAKKRRGGR